MNRYVNKLIDPYAELDEWVRKDIVGGTPGQPAPVRLALILENIQERSEFVARLLADAVYVVLNHPPLRSPSGPRHFFAAMNMQNVAPRTRTHLKNMSSSSSTPPQDPACRLFFLGNTQWEHLQDAAQLLWHNKWLEYWDITVVGEKSHGLYTWNQLLLKKGAHPLPLGVCWHPSCRGREAAPYFHLSPSLAEDIGLPNPTSPTWQRRLLDLDTTPANKHILQHAYNPKLDSVLRAFNHVDPTDDQRTTGAVAWALFHLVRSYAIWGGGAFLSIPVLIGAHGVSRTAVLSICTKAPLSRLAYREWKLVAGVLFRPLVEEEMANLVKRLDFAEAAYDIGHPMKNRVMPLSRALDQLELDINTGTSVQNLQKVIREARTCLRIIEYLGHVLDALARAMKKEEKERVFLAKPEEWTDTQPYNLTAAFDMICNRALPASCCQEVTRVSDQPTVTIWIDPWIPDSESVNRRPHDLFYDELLQELVINAAKHCHLPDRVELQMRVNDIPSPNGPLRALVISNPLSLENRDDVVLTDRQWREYSLAADGSVGGLPILATFIQATGLSREGYGIFTKVDAEGRRARFSVALPLKGLRCTVQSALL